MLYRGMRIIGLTVAFLGLLIALNGQHLGAQGSGTGSITILHTQEHHGQVEPARAFGGNDLGGLAARATLIERIRTEVGAGNTVLVDTGDILIGTPVSSIFRGEPTVLAYNAMNYDAVALGNHEFDFEQHENRLEILMALSEYPLMGANVNGLSFEADPGFVKLNRGGLNILVIGIANPETDTSSNPSPGTVFADPVSTARDVIAAEGENADLIVAITHQDTFRDVSLLNSVPEIDVVIGGHTLGFEGMITRKTSENIDELKGVTKDQPVALVNPDGVYVRVGGGPFSGRLGTSLGRLDLVVEGGNIVQATAANILVYPDTPHNRRDEEGAPPPENLLSPDAEILSIINPFLEELQFRLSHPIGVTTVYLDGARENVRSGETNLGNFIADVLRLTQHTDIGLQNGGGIRNSILAGDITAANVLSVQPFGNTVVRFTITGAQLLEAMENGVSRVEEGSGRFPHVSGMTLIFDSSKEPGQRVVRITVGGKPLELNKRYSVTTNSFIGYGGDGYTMFDDAEDFVDTQHVDADVLSDFIRETNTISPQVEGRIKDVARQ